MHLVPGYLTCGRVRKEPSTVEPGCIVLCSTCERPHAIPDFYPVVVVEALFGGVSPVLDPTWGACAGEQAVLQSQQT